MTDHYNEALTEDGYTIETTVIGANREDDWFYFEYSAVIKRNGKLVYSCPSYRMGVGHVDTKKLSVRSGFRWGDLQVAAEHVFNGRTLKVKEVQLSVYQKVVTHFPKALKKPTLADVLNSLVLDGSAYLDAQRFEDWAGDFGYDSDSIKAKRIFEQCDETGRALVQALGRDECERLREFFQDY